LVQKAPAALEQLKLTTALAQLDSASQQAVAHGWSYSHFLGYLLEAELQERYRRTVKLNLQFARFPYQKRLELCGVPGYVAKRRDRKR